ncbi:regulator of microtubule dynamics protein 1 isoform X2 [Molothrus ater]|uniref:regulator of microtubule dynamics protein 1 isoform X2 n=1 Tax=Molothrus ater TaxID=84834 RepID=UPI0023E833AD|nr:regulator of microtubule dynamics protein 1 isoform X2 [Molothrus ater]
MGQRFLDPRSSRSWQRAPRPPAGSGAAAAGTFHTRKGEDSSRPEPCPAAPAPHGSHWTGQSGQDVKPRGTRRPQGKAGPHPHLQRGASGPPTRGGHTHATGHAPPRGAGAEPPCAPPPAPAGPAAAWARRGSGARPRNVRPAAQRAARPGGRPLPLCAPEPGQGRGAERLLRRRGAVLAAAMAALMAALARPFRRGPAGLGTALRREAMGGPCGRGTQVLRKSLQRGVVLSTGSFLVYEAHKLISGFAEVHASFKVEDVIEQADYLYGSGETEKLYRLLVQHKNSDDAELLWRLARSSRDLAQLGSTSAEEKKKLTYDSLEYAKKALEKNESNFAAHKWYGICLSDVGDYEGIKTKIGNAIIIKEHFQRAIELNPKDATTIHLIGIWCYSFAEMPWYQRKIAATLFATPPTSTFQEALRYFHMAEEAFLLSLCS